MSINQVRSGPSENSLAPSPGDSYPVGATVSAAGVNFCVYSRGATGIALALFDHADDAEPSQLVRLDPEIPPPSKMAGIEEILAAVRKVAAGGTAFSDTVRRAARSALRPPTPRESQILALVAEGHGNAEIAESLSLRVKTVESQLRRMFDRYDVESRTSLVRVAQRQGWIEGDR